MQLSQPTLEPHVGVIFVEYKLCTHSCLLYSFPLVPFGDTLLLLSSGDVEEFTRSYQEYEDF